MIGLEVHAQLNTKSKIFCNCSTLYGAVPNTQVCPVCLGLPGSLPALNKKAVEYALMMALATNCHISRESNFGRKNYFYPDLPKGYQISQYELPLAENGFLEIKFNGASKKIGLARIHLEEDAGKSAHDYTSGVTYIDFNRSGVPLIEIVSKPEISSAEEAVNFLKGLRSVLRYLGISTGNMEEGSFRCDANLSLRPKDTQGFGTRSELKNLNSFKHVQKALEYETARQKNILENGEEVVQETRLWNENEGKTYSMRGKEESRDYRYFPEPDLVPLIVDRDWTEALAEGLTELPDKKRKRFAEQHGLPDHDSGLLTSSRALAEYFEDCVREAGDPKMVCNWITSELLRELKDDEKEIEECPVSPPALAELLTLIKTGAISGRIGKKVLKDMYRTGKSAQKIVKNQELVQITDERQIVLVIKEVLKENPEQVKKYKNGKERLLGFFVGQAMKKTKGKANPQIVNAVLERELKG